MTLETELDRLEAARSAASGAGAGSTMDLASRLEGARKRCFVPTHTEAELRIIAARDDLAGRVARGWLRLGPDFYLATASPRDVPAIDAEQAIVDTMGAVSRSPLRFATFAFENLTLRKWQRELLDDIGERLEAGHVAGLGEVIQRAVASGHAAGKSMVVAILILWGLSTFELTRITVTANNESQLQTKTFGELAKWHRISINAGWFIFTTTQLYSADKRHARNWRADALPWSEERPEGFAGLHNQGRRTILIFDEAAGIPPVIWETAEGALTDADTEMLWVAFGQCTRASGRFYDALTEPNSRWAPRSISTLGMEGVSQDAVRARIEDYGPDSDYVRVRVYGLPPRAGDLSFFNRQEAEEAMRRPVTEAGAGYPMVIGVDVARRGGDASVLSFRKNLDARSWPLIKLHGLDLMQLASRVAAEAIKFRALGQRMKIMCDGTGLGAGVVDRLKQLGWDVVDVQFSAKAPDPEMYANLRAAMHGELRDSIRKGLALPDDKRLLEQIAAIEYGHTPAGAILIAPKDDVRDVLGYSPDELDSICCTFAAPVDLVPDREPESRDDIWRREARERMRAANGDPRWLADLGLHDSKN